jgi:iturin family lipopeptide synthetase A
MKSYANLAEAFLAHKDEKERGMNFMKKKDSVYRITYDKLVMKSLLCLGNLQKQGIKKGDMAIFQIDEIDNFVFYFWGCIIGGIVPVPIATASTNDTMLRFYLVWKSLKQPFFIAEEHNFANLHKYVQQKEEQDAVILAEKFISSDTVDNLTEEGIPCEISEHDISLLQYSSGSTGTPKGVAITHANVILDNYSLARSAWVTEEDIFASWLPLTHNLGLIVMHLLPTTLGCEQFLLTKALFASDPLYYMDVMSKNKCSVTASPNFGFSYIASSVKEDHYDWDFTNLRCIWNGAEPINVKACELFLQKFGEYGLKDTVIVPGYGMTEATVVISVNRGNTKLDIIHIDRKDLFVGKKITELEEEGKNSISFVGVGPALDCVEVRICDDHDNVLDEYYVGHIQVKGNTVMKKYFGEVDSSDMFTADHWLRTGDIGFLHKKKLIITGRAKELILINGQNFYPHDLERMCEEIDFVQKGKVVVTNVYERKAQEECIAVFIEVQNVDWSEFRNNAKKIVSHLNGQGISNVRYVIPVEVIPKTNSGKFRRNDLRKNMEDGAYDEALNKIKGSEEKKAVNTARHSDRNLLEDKILKIYHDVTGDKLNRDESFFEHAINSLNLIKITQRIKEILQITISTTDIFNYPSIEKLAKYIEESKLDYQVQKEERVLVQDDSDDIAVIGMACRFPQADNEEEFWINVRNGLDNTIPYPKERLQDIEALLEDAETTYGTAEIVEGGYLKDIAGFDCNFFHITPKDAEILPPEQRLFLETACKALEDSGYFVDEKKMEHNIGVFVGASKSDYEKLLEKAEGYNCSKKIISNLSSMISGRVSYSLNLTGPALTIDTACSSSLVAISEAVISLMNKECNMAIAGGVRVNMHPVKTEIGIESADQRTRTFDNASDGTSFGEGVGAVILKPLKQAIKDQDHIYGVIKSIAVNQDGKTAGITVPNSISQMELIRKAWQKSDVNPECISYMEAHGTGTTLGDPIELDGIQKAFRQSTDKKHFCAVGSVKSNIGHLLEAAGIAGFTKLLLMLQYEEIPPVVHFQKLNEKIDLEDSAIYIADRLQPLKSDGGPVTCGISSFGFSGTNCHILLQEYVPEDRIERKNHALNLFAVSAKAEEALVQMLKAYIAYLENGTKDNIDNICYTAVSRRRHYECRTAFVVRNKEELLEKLKERLYTGENTEIKTATGNEAAVQADKVTDMTEQDLYHICNEYLAGRKIAWDQLYPDEEYEKVHVPTYQFMHNHCWAKVSETGIKVIRGKKAMREVKSSWVEGQFLNLIKKVSGLQEEEIPMEKDFLSMGFDSLVLLQLKNSIKNTFGIEIPVNSFFEELSTTRKVLDYLVQNVDTPESERYQEEIAISLAPERIENIPEKSSYQVAEAGSFHGYGNNDSVSVRFSEGMIEKQLDIMKMQLSFLSVSQMTVSQPKREIVIPEVSETQGEKQSIDNHTVPCSKNERTSQKQYKPYVKLNIQREAQMTPVQLKYLDSLIEEFCQKTKGSKNNIQKYRKVYANNRNIAGFRMILKEMVYQLVSPKAKGSKIWDVDDNEYLDLTMGFGVNLFGHNPDFIVNALKDELELGYSLGPMSEMAGQVAQKICQMTGVERVAFYNSGTEADMVACRIARAVSGKKKIVIFAGSYHGTFDGVLGIPGRNPEETLPLAPGIMKGVVEDLYVLNYGTEDSLAFIKEHGHEIAGVLVETVQSRRPDFRPKEFLQKLRRITREENCALIFDEVITGFRIMNGGAQQWYGITADIVTFGKIIGGGMPIGVVSGKAEYLDSIDGGFWSFGNQSFPQKEEIRTFVAGTFCHHPMAMAAANAVLDKLKEQDFQTELNRKTENFAKEMNQFFEEEEIPIQIVYFGSLFRFVLKGDLDLFYYILVTKEIYVWEGRNCFFSTAHTDDDIRKLMTKIQETVQVMRANGFISPKSEDRVNATFRLSDSQKEMAVGILFDKDINKLCNETVIFDMQGALDYEKMQESADILADRHDVFHISVDLENEMQVFQKKKRIYIKIVDCTSSTEPVTELKGVIKKAQMYEFDLSCEPLVRLCIVKYKENCHKLILTVHHLLVDGWSQGVIISELGEIYNCLMKNQQVKLPKSKQFFEFLDWSEKQINREMLMKAGDYWKERFSQKVTGVLTEGQKSFQKLTVGKESELHFFLKQEQVNKLSGVANENRATLFTLLLSAFSILVYRLTNEAHIGIGVPFAGQLEFGDLSLIGQTDQVLPIIHKVDAGATLYREMEAMTRDFTRSANYQKYPISRMAESIGAQNIPDIKLMFNMDEVVVPQFYSTITRIEVQGTNLCSNELFVNIMHSKEGIQVQFRYLADYFDKKQVYQWCAGYAALLQGIILGVKDTIQSFPIQIEPVRVRDELYYQEVPTSTLLPQTKMQEEVWKLFQSVLGTQITSIHEGFFSLGGNSMKMMLLKKNIETKLGKSIGVKELFQNNTVRRMAALLEGGAASQERTDMIPLVNRDYYPVTAIQKAMYISNMTNPDSTEYNIHEGLVFKDGLDKDKLEKCLKKLVERQKVCKSYFFQRDGVVYQAELKEFAPPLKEFAVDSWDDARHEMEQFIQPFHMHEGNLFRVCLIHIKNKESVVFFDFHHSIADGDSAGVFYKELLSMYQGNELEPLPYQLWDYASYMEKYYQGAEYKEQERYWKKEFEHGLSKAVLPFRRPGVKKSGRSNTITVQWDKDTLSRIKKAADIHGCTVFVLLCSVYQILLSKYSGSKEIVTGVPSDGRNIAGTERLVGMFVNTLLVRTDFSTMEKIGDVIGNVQDKLLSGMQNQEVSYQRLLEILSEGQERERSVIPFLFSMQRDDNEYLHECGMNVSKYEMPVKHIAFDIVFNCCETEESLVLSVDYASELYLQKDIDRMLHHYATLFEQILDNQEIPLSNLSLLNGKEIDTILRETVSPQTMDRVDSHITIKELFERQVEKTPDQIAVKIHYPSGKQQSITYRKLNENANKLARCMQKRIEKQQLVGLICENSIEMITMILASFKAGNVYVPIDRNQPQKRLASMIESTNIHTFLMEETDTADKAYEKLKKVYTDINRITPSDASMEDGMSNLAQSFAPEDLAYIIFTSGTTGKPKGVMINQNSIGLSIQWRANEYKLNTDDKVLQLFSYVFDGFLTSSLTPLVSGATLILLDSERDKDAFHILNRIREEKITHFIIVPTLYHALLQIMEEQDLDCVRSVTLAGESTSAKLIQLSKERNKNVELVNEYGPTENAVVTTCKRNMQEGNLITIGKPVDGTRVYILDEYGNLLPKGIPGELCIGGKKLARGYLGEEKKTKECFVENHYEKGERLYFTGDIAKWTNDGEIEFIGRKDSQVNVKGYRVELGEVEKTLSQCQDVKNCVVLSEDNEQGITELIAFYVAQGQMERKQVRQYAMENLPAYMIPSYFVEVSEIPYTNIGKVNTKELLLIERPIGNSEEIQMAANETENILCDIWKEVLGLEKVGRNQSFYECGGDSIKAIQVASMCAKKKILISTADIIKYQTVEEIVKWAQESKMISSDETIEGEVPLTPIQKWFFAQELEHEDYFNQAVLLKNQAGWKEDYVSCALERIVVHHDALRMQLKHGENGVLQYNCGEYKHPILIGKRNLPNEEETAEFMKEDADKLQKELSLEQGKMILAKIYQDTEAEYLVIIIHHLVVDGVSWRIILEDFCSLYTGQCNQLEVMLQGKTTSFQRFGEIQRELANSYKIKNQYKYWNQILSVPCVSIRKRELVMDTINQQRVCEKAIRIEKKEKVKAGKAYRTVFYELLLAAFIKAIGKKFGDGKYLLDLEAHGREEIERSIDLSRTVGWFTVQYPFLAGYEEKMSREHLLIEVKENMRKVPEHGIGFGILKYLSSDCGRQEWNKKPEIVFNYLGEFDSSLASDSIEVADYDYGETVSGSQKRHHVLECNVLEQNDNVMVSILYNKSEFLEEEMMLLTEEFTEEIEQFVKQLTDRKESKMTPSDYGNNSITMEELRKANEKYKNGIEKLYDLTPMQLGMLYDYRLNQNTHTYFEQVILHLQGLVDKKLMEESFQHISNKHTALRTTFENKLFEIPQQVILKDYAIDFSNLNYSGKLLKKEALEEFCEKDKQIGFKLDEKVPMRVTLFQFAEEDYYLVWSFHHILMDGWCINILVSDLVEYYLSGKSGEKCKLEKSSGYESYQNWLSCQDKDAAICYWRDYLKDYEKLIWTGNTGKEPSPGFERGDYYFSIAQDRRTGLLEFCRNQMVTLANTFQAIWAVILNKYFKQNDIVFGIIVSGRNAEIEGIEDTVGLFINTLPIRIRIEDDCSLVELSKKIERDIEEHNRFSFISLAELKAESKIPGELFDNILSFENYANYGNYNTLLSQEHLGFKLESVNEFEQTNFNLTIVVEPKEDEIGVHVIYNQQDCNNEFRYSIEKFFIRVIEQVLSKKDLKVSQVSVLDETEINEILSDFMEDF